MLTPHFSPVLLSLFPFLTNAATLFAAQSNGDLSTLSLTRNGTFHHLSIASNTREAGGNPSWLTLDAENRILYCLDRGQSNATKGSLNSFAIGEYGALSRIDTVDAPFSGVAAAYIDINSTTRGYVTASYNKSAIAAFLFPNKNGSLAPALQTLYPTSPTIGPIPSRQNGSFSHHVIPDPTGRYILVPDLGADLIRVFRFHETGFAPLQELASLQMERGVGPRHAVFWDSGEGWVLLVNGELSQRVYSYKVVYTEEGLSWEKVGDVVALGGKGEGLKANTAPISGIVVSPDQRFVTISSREHSFPSSPLHKTAPSDSLCTFKVCDNGLLSLVQVAPSGGYLPRQFSINKKGDRVAVGHQGNSTVVILDRDVKSGKVGEVLAKVEVGGPVVYTMWDE